MYIGDSKISTMQTFILGYLFAIDTHSIKEKEPIAENYFQDFSEFTARKLGKKPNGKRWATIITEFKRGDEELALNTFFEIFEEFVASKSLNA